MKNMNESEQWLLEQARANLLSGNMPETPELADARRLGKAVWPFMLPYFSPLCPAFSFEIATADNFLRQKTWLLRDGAIPLGWFFNAAAPALAEFGTLLVHSSLGGLVPRAWRKNIKFYDHFSHVEYSAANPPENLFLTGPVSAGITTIPELEAILDKTEESLGKNFKGNVLIYCPVRQLEFANAEEESFEFQFAQRVLSRFGKKVQFLHWQNIEHATFRNTAFVDLNGGWIYKDSFMLHQLLSRGAGLLAEPAPAIARESSRISLSPFHGMSVSSVPAAADFTASGDVSTAMDFFTALHKKTQDPRSHYPWPKWYQGMARATLRPDQNN
jgi:hypothetical protein